MPILGGSGDSGPDLGYTVPGDGSSGSSGGDRGSKNGYGNLIGEGVSLLTGLFGSNPAKDKAAGLTDNLSTLAKSLSDTGDKSTKTGMDALQPVLKYLNGLISGNPADTLAATAPERASVLSQYDTARQSIVRNTPRGGGFAEALSGVETKQASDLATLPAKARSDAVDKASQLGTTLTGQGVQAKSAAGSDLATAVQAAQRQSEQQAQSNKDSGSAIGGFIADAAMALMFL